MGGFLVFDLMKKKILPLPFRRKFRSTDKNGATQVWITLYEFLMLVVVFIENKCLLISRVAPL